MYDTLEKPKNHEDYYSQNNKTHVIFKFVKNCSTNWKEKKFKKVIYYNYACDSQHHHITHIVEITQKYILP